MKYVIIILAGVLLAQIASAGALTNIAMRNGFKGSSQAFLAIQRASLESGIPQEQLFAIAIVESGIGSNKGAIKHHNRNGSIDIGMFQINSINFNTCKEFNLKLDSGNARCAAKILLSLKKRFPRSYLGRYHSHSKAYRQAYEAKIKAVIQLEVRSIADGF